MKKVLKETASAGSTGGGAIATVPHRLGDDMRRRESLKGFLLRFYKGLSNKTNMKTVKPYFTGIKEAYDLSDVVSQLKGLENSDVKDDNTVTYGVEDDNGNIMKISVKRDQAKDFEYRLASDMADAKDSHMSGTTSKVSLAELLYDLKDEFNIVDVEFPKIPKDVIYNADKATKAPPDGVAPSGNEGDEMDDMNPDQNLEGQGDQGGEGFDENGAPLQGEGEEGEKDLEQGESDFDEEGEEPEGDDESVEDFGQEASTEGSPESILQQVMDMLKAQAEAETAKANAAAEESRAKQAEYSYKSAQATVAHEAEFAQMEADADEQKQKQKDAKRLADLAKSKVQKASAFRESRSILGQVINEMEEDPNVIPLFVDDWAVYGKDASGKWYYTICEMWPEWADFKKQPEDMSSREFASTIAQIFKRRGHFSTSWRPVYPQHVDEIEQSYKEQVAQHSPKLIKESILNELDDMDNEQSINRAKQDLRMKWKIMPGDTPETVAYKQRMYQDGMQELATQSKSIKTRNMYNMQQKQLQAKAQAQLQNQNPSQTNQAQPNANPSMNGM